jgi:lactate permease
MLILRARPALALRTYVKTLAQLKWAILTVAAVLALAYVMNLSGQTATIGLWLAGAGTVFAFLSGLIGAWRARRATSSGP